MAQKIRGFFTTALENLVSYRTAQMSRYAVRDRCATRQDKAHNLLRVML